MNWSRISQKGTASRGAIRLLAVLSVVATLCLHAFISDALVGKHGPEQASLDRLLGACAQAAELQEEAASSAQTLPAPQIKPQRTQVAQKHVESPVQGQGCQVVLWPSVPPVPVQSVSLDADRSWPLQVHLVDVGHGDCILIKCQDHAWLIDGGKWDRSYKVQQYLATQGIRHLEAVVCTHEHQDHVGGLSQILSNLRFDRMFALPAIGKKHKGYDKAVRHALKLGVPVIEPEWDSPYQLGDALLSFFGPVTLDSEEPINHRINNRSLVLRLTYGEHSFLLTGDAERHSELEYIKKYGASLKSTVLKVGHHGSWTSTCQEFLDCVQPKLAVISTNQLESEGKSPNPQVLRRLRGVELHRTDIDGNIVIKSDGKRLEVETEK